MKIGVPREVKDNENRVALIPAGAAKLVEQGHSVYVEAGAGLGSGFADDEYARDGAVICDAATAWDVGLVLKVKEPLPSEYGFLRDQIVFTFFHLAGVARELTEVLLERQTTAVAYETLEDEWGRRPILAPMSAVAGNMAAQVGGYYLSKPRGGSGMQLGMVLGKRYGRVLVIGDGVVAFHAARTAHHIGAHVAVAGLNAEKGARLQAEIDPSLEFFLSEPNGIAHHVRGADLVIGAVLKSGARADYVVTEAMVRTMRPGSVIVDVSIDQGGCVETSRPTSHSDPVFIHHGVIHYCVTNMPGAYPRTSTLALTDATLPYALQLAESGPSAFGGRPCLMKAVNTYRGFITCEPVAHALDWMDRYRPLTGIRS